ncbi:putative polysaccharide biosynthesis protein [Velocimicrobium porci]|uniref:Polysaccharide biosynthesis protein n=1 Tax=Velocimicrobium porci TaxID=2606634 RepID=A0A6L5XZN9_9FIRM|nr:polysaccharide biosynthesis protein [Velocimicrobium porci]MSS63941.1 polysaccharide biosynthesis protein [Velocimicrobium porci]
MKNKSKNNILIQATVLTVAGILVRIIGILYRSPLTSIISDEGNGIYSSAYNIYTMILLISSYSIPSAISKVISSRLALHQYKNAHRVFQCSLIYVVVVGSLASLFTFVCAPFLVSSNAVIPLRILAPTIFFSGLLGAFRGYFQAYNSMVQTSISQILEQLINAIVSITAAYYFTRPLANTSKESLIPLYGASGSALGTISGVLVALLFILFVYHLNHNFFKHRIDKDIKSVPESYSKIFKTTILLVTPVIFSTFIYNITPTLDMKFYYKISMDVKHLTQSVTTSNYGIFAGKYTVIMNIPIAFASAMSSAMIPSISASFAKDDIEETKAKISQSIRSTMIIAFPCAVGMSVLAYPIVSLLFPQKESIDMASSLLRYGGISVIFYSLSTLTNAVLQGIGKVNIPVKNAIVALIIHLAVLIPLLNYTDLDLYALLLGTILYSLIMCILNGLSVKKCLGYVQDIQKTFLIPGVASVIMGIGTWASYYVTHLLLKSNILSLCVSIPLSAVLYFCIVLLLKGVTEEELKTFPKGTLLIRIAKKAHLM